MLEISDLRFRYSRHSPTVLDGVNLRLGDGEIGILLGKNGSGKTTLFKNILGIETPSGGSIRFDGEAPESTAAEAGQTVSFGNLENTAETTAISTVRYINTSAADMATISW